MRHRYLVSLAALLGTLVLVLLAPFPIAGQSAGTAKPGAAPRTPWGDPDLQGVWHVTSGVPLERPEQYAGREFLTDKEVEELDRQKAGNQGRNTRAANATQDVGGAYNAVFNSILKTGKRTSMIIDPPDGRIPPLTAEAQKRQGGRGGQGRGGGGQGARGGGQGAGGGQAAAPAQGGGGNQAGQADNPEAIGSTRCLGVQSPFLPLNTAFAQGTVMRLVQSPKSVAIYMEDDHAGGGVRTIPLDGSAHLPSTVRTYLGDSRGRWTGNTLVVETTNFLRPFRGSDVETFKMTERFTRVDANNLRREVTFDDPRTWTRPWTVLIEMGRFDDSKHMIFDSACHEGNYGMTGILVGARMEEKARAGNQTSTPQK
jgi:hypothetical protein